MVNLHMNMKIVVIIKRLWLQNSQVQRGNAPYNCTQNLALAMFLATCNGCKQWLSSTQPSEADDNIKHWPVVSVHLTSLSQRGMQPGTPI